MTSAPAALALSAEQIEEIESILATIDNQAAGREVGCLSMRDERILAAAIKAALAAPAPAEVGEDLVEAACKAGWAELERHLGRKVPLSEAAPTFAAIVAVAPMLAAGSPSSDESVAAAARKYVKAVQEGGFSGCAWEELCEIIDAPAAQRPSRDDAGQAAALGPSFERIEELKADQRKLDAVVHALGIEDSEDDPAEVITATLAAYEALQAKCAGLMLQDDAHPPAPSAYAAETALRHAGMSCLGPDRHGRYQIRIAFTNEADFNVTKAALSGGAK